MLQQFTFPPRQKTHKPNFYQAYMYHSDFEQALKYCTHSSYFELPKQVRVSFG